MPLTDTTLIEYGRGNVFIETGTLKGDGIQKALDAGFTEVHSIEIDGTRSQNARVRFSKEVDEGTVNIVCGDSRNVLRKLLPFITEEMTVWLDAHDTGTTTLYEELEIIRSYSRIPEVLMIDDMRVTGDPEHKWGYLVNPDRIKELVYRICPSYKIEFADGEHPEDILVASYE